MRAPYAPAPVRRVAFVDSRVPKWRPPLDESGLRHVLERITAWSPLDFDAIFDDCDAAIGNQPPPEADTPALIERLRSHLKRLRAIVVAETRFRPSAELALLVERGHHVQTERLADDYQQAVGLARRLAFLTSDLVEKLIEDRYIKDVE
ncbi:DUF6415 family natural product biosynthesis protein [Streptomyces sp. NPDC002932]|uniref:DUF6415 family natural product biosynthesis protein n=1 Tax=Streptomyces sp. NPDC002932 TaxID=3364672 RepID=UPI0036B43E76